MEDKIELVDVYTGLDETYQVEKKTAEVWYFRYIDDEDIAKEIIDKGLTLEEYLQNK